MYTYWVRSGDLDVEMTTTFEANPSYIAARALAEFTASPAPKKSLGRLLGVVMDGDEDTELYFSTEDMLAKIGYGVSMNG